MGCAACGRALDAWGDPCLCDGCQSLNEAPPWPEGIVVVRDYPSLQVVEVWDGDKRVA